MKIGTIFKLKDEVKRVVLLRTRVRYGIKSEVLPLIALKGIGRVRARSLFDAGYRDLRSISEASEAELPAAAGIGKTLALDTRSQASDIAHQA